jgi:hypothetical protein
MIVLFEALIKLHYNNGAEGFFFGCYHDMDSKRNGELL